tara:strand:- start:447 stop:1325 length:879 start_codon:yes stop_codon:yes gene_type:complete
MKKTKIGIIGQGFVGNAIYEGFKSYYEVFTYDKYLKEKSNADLEMLVKKSNIIFICVPTPMLSNGKCHTEIVEDVLNDVNNICKAFDEEEKICVIKSTVIPGTTKKLNKKFKNISIIFNPEFLTEVNAISDWKNQSRIILGGYYKITTKVKPIFAKVFPKITIVKTDSDYAEMVKYVTNTFLSTKVSFANEIYEICKSLDIDYDKVIEYSQYDDRLGKSHWSVPGPDGDFGYGGHCFPKDLSALIYLAEDLNLKPIVLRAIREKNNKVRNNRDWEKMEGRAIISSTTIKNKI